MLVFDYWWVFFLLPLPWLLRSVLPARQIRRAAVRVPFGDRLSAALGPTNQVSDSVKSHRGLALRVVFWLLVLAAVARPQWIEPPVTKDLPTRDLLLLVDLSSSMDQEDFTNKGGDRVSRLTAVKEVLGDFLLRREGDRVGLVVFGDAPYLQSPFSIDLELSRKLLEECEVGMAGPRTAFGDAIGLGVNLFDQSDAPAKTMIALTDGNDTKSQVPPIEAARVAAQRDIDIHTVAIGDPATVGEDKLDEAALREVADAANGSYFFAGDRDSLEGIYEELDEIETREVKTVSHRPRRDLFFLPLLVAMFVSMLDKVLAVGLFSGLGKRVSIDRQPIEVNPITGKLEVRT
jgi:Ca-activated chloride channel family protein